MNEVLLIDELLTHQIDVEAIARRERLLDEALEESFPASDPVAAYRFN